MAQNIEMQCKQSDGSYETLLPKTQSSLITLNNTDLGNHLGGNTTVEGSLDYLSRMYAYWWKRVTRVPKYELSYDAAGGSWPRVIFSAAWPSNKIVYFSFSVGSKIEIDQISGKIKEDDWKTYNMAIKYDPYDESASWYNNGVLVGSQDVVGVIVKYNDGDNDNYYASSNNRSFYVTHRESSNSSCIITMSSTSSSYQGSACKVSVKTTYIDGGTDYVYSFSRDAYPDSGTVGNYTYTYLGIPFENAMKDGPK